MQRMFSPKLNDSENVVAYIKGSEKPDEYIVLSAHYDHVGMANGEIYNGADDNGTGTTALMEIARIFQTAYNNGNRSEEHTSELQSRPHLVCRLLLEKKK